MSSIQRYICSLSHSMTLFFPLLIIFKFKGTSIPQVRTHYQNKLLLNCFGVHGHVQYLFVLIMSWNQPSKCQQDPCKRLVLLNGIPFGSVIKLYSYHICMDRWVFMPASCFMASVLSSYLCFFDSDKWPDVSSLPFKLNQLASE